VRQSATRTLLPLSLFSFVINRMAVQILEARVTTTERSAQWRYVLIRPSTRSNLEQVSKLQRSGRVCTGPYREALDRAGLSAELLQWPHNCLRHSFSSYSLLAEENEAGPQMEWDTRPPDCSSSTIVPLLPQRAQGSGRKDRRAFNKQLLSSFVQLLAIARSG
jgi:hypothetical protein